MLLITTPFVVAELGPSVYGAWVVVVGIAGLFGVVDVGFAPAVGRVVAHSLARHDRDAARQSIATALAGNLAIGTVLGVVAWLLVPTFASAVSSDGVAGLETALRLATVTAVLVNAGGVVDGALIGIGRIEALAKARVLYAGLFGAGVAVVLAGDGGLTQLALAQLIAWAIAIAVAGVWLRLAFGGPVFSLRAMRLGLVGEILRYGAPSQASRLSLIGALQYERVMVGAMIGVTAAAGYGLASLLAGGLRMLLGQAVVPLVPKLTAMSATEGLAAARRAYEAAMRTYAIVFAGCFGALAAAAPVAIAAWVGPGFEEAARYVWILALGFTVSALATTGYALAQAAARPAIEAKAAAITTVGYGVAVAALLAAFGTAGAAIGTTLGLVAGGCFCFYALARTGTASLPSAMTVVVPVTVAALVALPLAAGGSALVAGGDLSRPVLALVALAAAVVHLVVFVGVLAAVGCLSLPRLSEVSGHLPGERAARGVVVAVRMGAGCLVTLAVLAGSLAWPTFALLVVVVVGVASLAWRSPSAAFVAVVLLFGTEGAWKLRLTTEGVPFGAPDAVAAGLLDLCLIISVGAVLLVDRLHTPRMVWDGVGRLGRTGIGLLVCWLALSPLHLALASSLRDGLEGLRLTQFYVLALPAAAVLFGRSVERSEALMRWLVGGFAAIAGYAGLRAVIGPSEPERVFALSQHSVTEVSTAFRAVGSFSSTVGLESYLVPVVAFCVASALLSDRRRAAALVALVGGLALVGSYGRAPIVAVVAVAVAFGGWMAFDSATAVRRRLTVALALALVLTGIGAGVVVAATVNEKAGERAKGLIDPLGDESVRLRLDTWGDAVDSAVRTPLGEGLGEIGDASGDSRVSKRETDNAFLKVLVEQGIVGGLAFMLGMVALVAGLWRRLTAVPPREAALGLAATAGVAGFALLATTGEFFEQPGKVVFWTLLGVALGQASTLTNGSGQKGAA